MSILSPYAAPNLLGAFQSIYGQQNPTGLNAFNMAGGGSTTGQYVLPGTVNQGGTAPAYNFTLPGAGGDGSQQPDLGALLAQIQQNPGNVGAPVGGVLPPGLSAGAPPSTTGPGGAQQPQPPTTPQAGPANWSFTGQPGAFQYFNQATGQMGTPQHTDNIMLPRGGSMSYGQWQNIPNYDPYMSTAPMLAGEGQGGGGMR